jgi:hypothetical protein
MSFEVQRLNDRLDRLEKENRRLKKWGGIAVAALGCLGLFGFAAPVVCDIVTGERLVIRDNSGRQRAGIDAYHTEAPGLTLHDASGRQRAKLGLDEKGDVSLSFFDEKGGAKASYLFAADGAPKAEPVKTGDKPVKADPSVASEETR